jgi:hypothetical protein
MQNGTHMQGTSPMTPSMVHQHIWLQDTSLYAAVDTSMLHLSHQTFDTDVLLSIILCLSF